MSDHEYATTVMGPGSQPTEQDGAELDFMPMPDEMVTYTMPDISVAFSPQANQVLAEVQSLLEQHPVANKIVELGQLNKESHESINEVLGEGEVSIVINDVQTIKIQESILAGLWRVLVQDKNGVLINDYVEVGEIPQVVTDLTFSGLGIQATIARQEYDEGVNNALPLIAELNDYIVDADKNKQSHVINLTLLPQSDADLSYLRRCLGEGKVTILSRGYGNCRVTSTATRNVWWVQYFNSQDSIILNTLEVTPIPSVVCASHEDLEDSAQRLNEIRQVYA